MSKEAFRWNKGSVKSGAVSPISFIIFATAAIIFVASLQLYHDTLLDFPSKVATEQQFNDLGNAFSTEIMEMILTLPHGGTVTVTERLPVEIGGHNYRILIPPASDQLQLYSFKGFSLNYTLSGMSAEVNASAVESKTAYGGVKELTLSFRRW